MSNIIDLFVDIQDVKSVLESFSSLDISDDNKEAIIKQLESIAYTPQKNNIETGDEVVEEEIKDEKEPTPKVKKQWALVLSDPNGTISGEYMGWALQMDEDENISDLNDKLIASAHEFNRSKKGMKCPVNSVGEAIMHVGAKFFKEQKVYIKNKEPVFITVIDNKLT